MKKDRQKMEGKPFSGRNEKGGTTGNDEGESFSLIGSASLIEFLGLQSAFVVSHAPLSSQTMFTHSDKVLQDYFLLFLLFYLDSHAGRVSQQLEMHSTRTAPDDSFFLPKSEFLP